MARTSRFGAVELPARKHPRIHRRYVVTYLRSPVDEGPVGRAEGPSLFDPTGKQMKNFYGIAPDEDPASVAKWDGTYVPFRMLPESTRAHHRALMQHLRDLNDDDADALRTAVLYVYEQLLLVGDFCPDDYEVSSDLFPELVWQVFTMLGDLHTERMKDKDAFRAAITRVAIAIYADAS